MIAIMNISVGHFLSYSTRSTYMLVACRRCWGSRKWVTQDEGATSLHHDMEACLPGAWALDCDMGEKQTSTMSKRWLFGVYVWQQLLLSEVIHRINLEEPKCKPRGSGSRVPLLTHSTGAALREGGGKLFSVAHSWQTCEVGRDRIKRLILKSSSEESAGTLVPHCIVHLFAHLMSNNPMLSWNADHRKFAFLLSF